MEPTITIDRSVPAPPSLWPITLQAFVGALFVGDQVLERWGTFDLYGKFMGVAILIGLVWGPAIELWRKRSGKEVRFSNLATSGYTLVWLTVILFSRHLR
ncbi:MAG: hypothetical protein WB683_16285 [Candidatus Sulfotelmatobacter sp.]